MLAEVYGSFPALSFEQRRDVADQAHNVAQALEYRPAFFYGTEESLATDITLADGHVCTVTGRLDYLEMGDGVARIFDVKSQYSIWPDSRVKDDFQLKTYAMLVLDTFPHVDRVEGRLLLCRYGHQPAAEGRGRLHAGRHRRVQGAPELPPRGPLPR